MKNESYIYFRATYICGEMDPSTRLNVEFRRTSFQRDVFIFFKSKGGY